MSSDGYPIEIRLDESMMEGEYHLSIRKEGVKLAAADPCSVFAGLGEFLLGWNFGAPEQEIIPPNQIAFCPENSFRGLYFATHFHNFYHTAPIEEVLSQVEDAAFRGGNVITVWYDMHHFGDFEEEESQRLVARLKTILGHAKQAGMKHA